MGPRSAEQRNSMSVTIAGASVAPTMNAVVIRSLRHRAAVLRQQSVVLRSESKKAIAANRELRAQHRALLSGMRETTRRSLRRIIRSKLFLTALPSDSVPIIVGGPGQGGLCDVCERPLRATQLVMAVPAEETFAHLHADCFLLWDDERRKAARGVNGTA